MTGEPTRTCFCPAQDLTHDGGVAKGGVLDPTEDRDDGRDDVFLLDKPPSGVFCSEKEGVFEVPAILSIPSRPVSMKRVPAILSVPSRPVSMKRAILSLSSSAEKGKPLLSR